MTSRRSWPAFMKHPNARQFVAVSTWNCVINLTFTKVCVLRMRVYIRIRNTHKLIYIYIKCMEYIRECKRLGPKIFIQYLMFILPESFIMNFIFFKIVHCQSKRLKWFVSIALIFSPLQLARHSSFNILFLDQCFSYSCKNMLFLMRQFLRYEFSKSVNRT
jgi:hypothetical protein